jgi:hypothetical protein
VAWSHLAHGEGLLGSALKELDEVLDLGLGGDALHLHTTHTHTRRENLSQAEDFSKDEVLSSDLHPLRPARRHHPKGRLSETGGGQYCTYHQFESKLLLRFWVATAAPAASRITPPSAAAAPSACMRDGTSVSVELLSESCVV